VGTRRNWKLTLKQGLEFFHGLRRARPVAPRKKMSVLRNMMIADRIVSLGLLAAAGLKPSHKKIRSSP